MPLFRGSSIFESLMLSHHSRFTCECDKEEIKDENENYFTVIQTKRRRIPGECSTLLDQNKLGSVLLFVVGPEDARKVGPQNAWKLRC